MRVLLGLGLTVCGFLVPFLAAWMVGHWRSSRHGLLVAVVWVLLVFVLAVLFGFDGLLWLLSALGLVFACVVFGTALIMFSLGMPVREISGVLRGRRRVS